jgi:hypothetical protein
VHYEVADEFRYAANCHCSRCRAATGSAFKAFAGIERDKVTLTEGGDRPLLYSVVREGEWVHVAMGSLVDEPSIRPSEHIYVGSKAPWHEITDDLPQNEELE